MKLKPVTIPASGHKLSGTLVIPSDTSTKLPAVIFYHGMVSQSKPRYIERAKRLAKVGIAALCFDFRGCGESDSKIEACSFSNWLDDALLAFDYLASQDVVDKKRIGIAGKSFGGYMAALVAEKRHVKSMALQAPAVFKDEWFNKSFAWTEEFKKVRTEYRKTKEALDNRAIRAMTKYKNPLFVFHSELDTITPRTIPEKYFSSSPAVEKKFVTIEGADHILTDEKHNEEYVLMMTDWFKATL